jgi:hypothetical protein
VIQQDEEGKSYAALNPDANGNAWFVDELVLVPNADREIMVLDSLDTQKRAVVNSALFPGVSPAQFQKDSTALISLTTYAPNRLTYSSRNANMGLAVFSEMYYPHGWQAYIDGKTVPHFRVNYALRALQVPPGEHTIEFAFEPSVVATGSKISLASSILLALLVLAGLIYKLKKGKPKEEVA